jgi:hypothetical protein
LLTRRSEACTTATIRLRKTTSSKTRSLGGCSGKRLACAGVAHNNDGMSSRVIV